MCGIVGYVGPRSAVPVVIDELKRLEYRGYDSAGVAVQRNGGVEVVKTVGKIADLEKLLDQQPLEAQIALGHTRWATHGQPSTPNSHPHTDCSGDLALVHNGIIENFQELKEHLLEGGHVFTSETDTEVIVHLIEEKLKDEPDIERALRAAVRDLEGAYALVLISRQDPGVLYVVRKDSPLVLGLGEGENFIASDIPAVLPYTRRVYILEDGDFGVVTPDGVQLKDIDGNPIEREVFEVTWDAGAAEKGGYDHFMIKEIHEIPQAIRDTLRGRVSEGNRILIDEMELDEELVHRLKRVYVVACGTAFYAGYAGKYLFERLLRVPVEADVASEFRYRNPIYEPDSLMIVISQSGETADTLAALRDAKAHGVPVLGIVNVIGSSIYREADYIFPTWAGPEICVASTKAYVTQVIALYLLVFAFARLRGQLSSSEVQELVAELKQLPARVQQVLDREPQLIELSKEFIDRPDFLFIGRGLDYAVSLEGALKLKEISYIHAEAYAAGELKHGPLALLTDRVPVVCTATQTELYDKMVSNIKEVKARRADAIGIVRESDTETGKQVDYLIKVPDSHDLLMPVLAVIPPYLITYYISRDLNREIDQPRNLAKSVTVE